MTLSSTASRISYAGNGSSDEFSFPYRFLQDADLVVLLVVDATGVSTAQILDTDYTVAGEGLSAGGTVTMATPPASGETLVIYRDVALTQDLDLVENDPLPVEEVEKRLDKAAMHVQRLADRVGRSIRLRESYSSAFDTLLPASLTANAILCVNSTGDGLALGASTTQLLAGGTTTEAVTIAKAGTPFLTIQDTNGVPGTDFSARIDFADMNGDAAGAIGFTNAGSDKLYIRADTGAIGFYNGYGADVGSIGTDGQWTIGASNYNDRHVMNGWLDMRTAEIGFSFCMITFSDYANEGNDGRIGFCSGTKKIFTFDNSCDVGSDPSFVFVTDGVSGVNESYYAGEISTMGAWTLGYTGSVQNHTINGNLAVTGSLAAGSSNYTLSTSCGSFSTVSTSFIDVTNLSVSITTHGRAVMLMLVGVGGGTYSSVAPQADVQTTSMQLQYLRGVTVIYNTEVTHGVGGTAGNNLGVTLPPCITTIDQPAAGTYTYKLQAKSSSGSLAAQVSNCKLIAIEL